MKNNKKYTTEEFINKAQLVHKNKYDYSLVEYVNSATKIKIVCEKHGVFSQIAQNHLIGKGCPKCGGHYMDNEYFIDEATIKHNGKYDYSLVKYIKSNECVIIKCPTHGIFVQRPSNHLTGCGCPKCAGKNITTEEFITNAKLIHGDKYDYSLVKYVNSKLNVKIICEKHGVFEQRPNNHLTGSNCLKCDNKNKTTEEFILQARNIHNDKYNYSLIEYIGSKLKVNIICPIHGVFKQIPNRHLMGDGCKSCSESKGEKAIAKYLVDNDIKYIREKRYDNCKNISQLPFDFYLPEYNLLIEYDGEQHFKSMDFFGGEKAFKIRIINDNIKNEYAKNNNIKLLRIRFDELNNIENILDNNIKIWQQIQQAI